MKTIAYTHNVKYYETDKMGIVHHSNYIRWYEEARVYYMQQVGVEFTEMEKRGIVIPVVSVNSQYKNMSYFADDVIVYITLEKYNGVRAMFSYEIRDSKTNQLRNVGQSEHCFMKNDRIVSLKRAAPDFHQIFAQCCE